MYGPQVQQPQRPCPYGSRRQSEITCSAQAAFARPQRRHGHCPRCGLGDGPPTVRGCCGGAPPASRLRRLAPAGLPRPGQGGAPHRTYDLARGEAVWWPLVRDRAGLCYGACLLGRPVQPEAGPPGGGLSGFSKGAVAPLGRRRHRLCRYGSGLPQRRRCRGVVAAWAEPRSRRCLVCLLVWLRGSTAAALKMY